MTARVVALALSVVLTAVSQILFKVGAARAGEAHWLRTYFNPHTVAAYCLLLVTTFLTTYAYKLVPLKMAVAVLPLTVILVGLLSRVVLRERLSRNLAIGSGLVLLGIVVYNAGAL